MHGTSGSCLYGNPWHGDHRRNAEDEPGHGVVSTNYLSANVELVNRRGPDLDLVAHVEIPDVAYYADHSATIMGLHDLVEDYLSGRRALHCHSVLDDRHINDITGRVEAQCLIGRARCPVAALGPGHALYQV